MDLVTIYWFYGQKCRWWKCYKIMSMWTGGCHTYQIVHSVLSFCHVFPHWCHVLPEWFWTHEQSQMHFHPHLWERKYTYIQPRLSMSSIGCIVTFWGSNGSCYMDLCLTPRVGWMLQLVWQQVKQTRLFHSQVFIQLIGYTQVVVKYVPFKPCKIRNIFGGCYKEPRDINVSQIPHGYQQKLLWWLNSELFPWIYVHPLSLGWIKMF